MLNQESCKLSLHFSGLNAIDLCYVYIYFHMVISNKSIGTYMRFNTNDINTVQKPPIQLHFIVTLCLLCVLCTRYKDFLQSLSTRKHIYVSEMLIALEIVQNSAMTNTITIVLWLPMEWCKVDLKPFFLVLFVF